MKTAHNSLSLKKAVGIAAAGAALLSTPAAFAQTSPAPFLFEVDNFTANNIGDPLYSVTDALTFTNLQINEGFANGSTQTILLNDLDTNTLYEQTDQFSTSSPLTSAVLTGTLNGLAPGSVLTVNLANSINGPAVPFNIYSNFSADLIHPATPAIGLGQFSQLDGNGNVLQSVVISAGTAPVPEASTVVSMSLLLALGLGALVVSRRRAASIN